MLTWIPYIRLDRKSLGEWNALRPPVTGCRAAFVQGIAPHNSIERVDFCYFATLSGLLQNSRSLPKGGIAVAFNSLAIPMDLEERRFPGFFPLL